MAEKKRVWDADMTRRHFLVMSGKGLAGMALSTAVMSLFGVSKAEIEAGVVSAWATPDALLVHNAARCSGCLRCELNCTLANDGEPSSYMSRIKVWRNLFLSEDGTRGIHSDSYLYDAQTCRQCADPACGNACPMKAIEADPVTGVRVINTEKCVGCGVCAAACPWHMPTVNPQTKKSTKCIACGKCAQGCIMGALAVIPWEDVAAAM